MMERARAIRARDERHRVRPSRAMESARLASIDPERAVMSSSTPIADAEDAEETLEAKGLVRTGSALRAVSADEAKRLNRMLSTDLREMMAAEVRGSRGSTLMRLTVRCPVVMMVISFSIWTRRARAGGASAED